MARLRPWHAAAAPPSSLRAHVLRAADGVDSSARAAQTPARMGRAQVEGWRLAQEGAQCTAHAHAG